MPQSIGIQLACKAVLNQPWVNIKKIDFTCSPFDLNTCELLAELIQAAAELETLNLSGCGSVEDAIYIGMHQFDVSIPFKKYLKFLPFTFAAALSWMVCRH